MALTRTSISTRAPPAVRGAILSAQATRTYPGVAKAANASASSTWTKGMFGRQTCPTAPTTTSRGGVSIITLKPGASAVETRSSTRIRSGARPRPRRWSGSARSPKRTPNEARAAEVPVSHVLPCARRIGRDVASGDLDQPGAGHQPGERARLLRAGLNVHLGAPVSRNGPGSRYGACAGRCTGAGPASRCGKSARRRRGAPMHPEAPWSRLPDRSDPTRGEHVTHRLPTGLVLGLTVAGLATGGARPRGPRRRCRRGLGGDGGDRAGAADLVGGAQLAGAAGRRRRRRSPCWPWPARSRWASTWPAPSSR